jgi:predicted dehydrogenase
LGGFAGFSGLFNHIYKDDQRAKLSQYLSKRISETIVEATLSAPNSLYANSKILESMSATATPSMEVEEKPLLIAGLGMWGQTWISIVNQSPYWTAEGYVDLEEERLESAVETYGISRSNCYTQFEDAVTETDVEAVLCVVPPDVHRDVAVQAFRAGLHVISEKPLAGDIEQGKEMIDTAKQAGKKLMVSQNYRYKKAPRTVRSLIARGLVGEPEYISIDFHKNPEFTGYRLHMDHPLLIDMSIHHFDQIRYILDANPMNVTARTTNTKWSNFDHDPIAEVTFEMNDGTFVQYSGNWASQTKQTTWDGDWRIDGTGGSIDWRNNEVTFLPTDTVTSVFQEGLIEKSAEGMADKGIMEAELLEMPEQERQYSLLEFYDAIENDREPETSGQDNINTFAMMRSAVEAAEKDTEISIQENL